MPKTLEVNGKPAHVLDGTVPKPPPFIEVPLESLVIQLAEHDVKINAAAVEHSKTGNALKALKEAREKMVAELVRRGEKLHAPSFDGIHNAAASEGIDEEE